MRHICLPLRFLILFIVLAGIFTLSGVAAYSIHKDVTIENTRESIKLLDREGLHPVAGLSELSMRDNYTDALMLGMAVCGTDSMPLCDAMGNPYYIDSVNNTDTRIAAAKVMRNDTASLIKSSYATYWHGYMLPLRVSSICFDLKGIRILSAVTLGVLFLITVILLWRKRPVAESIAFIFTALTLTPWVVATSLQFASVFFVLLIALISLLSADKTFRKPENLYLAFFTIGAFTSFLDLLTAPLLTLGIPLAAYLYSIKLNRKKRITLLAIISWGAGYALLWASKWALASWLSPFNVISDAGASIAFRTAGALPDYITTGFIIKSAISIIALLAIILSILLIIRKRNPKEFRSSEWLLIIAALPLVWYAVLYNHTIIHYWFAWRSAGVSIFCLILFVCAVYKNREKHISSKHP